MVLKREALAIKGKKIIVGNTLITKVDKRRITHFFILLRHLYGGFKQFCYIFPCLWTSLAFTKLLVIYKHILKCAERNPAVNLLIV